MRRSNRELWLAFFAMAGITMIYLYVVIQVRDIPGASGLFGHSLGILGFTLMLMTETLYSLRKRSRSARWGRLSSWLRFHIFTGLVGPYMVLLHTSWKFNGLAGIVTLLTLIIVLSGIVGRYIYTSIPRTADGAEIDLSELEQQASMTKIKLNQLKNASSQNSITLAGQLASMQAAPKSSFLNWPGNPLTEYRIKRQMGKEQKRLNAAERIQVDQLRKVAKKQRILERQIASLALARRALALWHTVHIPIGVALFITAFVHIVAAIYYATLLR